uniref:Phosphoinositide phospholipase C n=1 Tax=Macrostomum lignano TaxID=282301 RepID=A0A1I8FH31_9PLAT
DLKLREICNAVRLGQMNPCLRVVHSGVIVGSDLVNLQWVNFVASIRQTAQSEFINAKVLTFEAFVKSSHQPVPEQDVDQICHEIPKQQAKMVKLIKDYLGDRNSRATIGIASADVDEDPDEERPELRRLRETAVEMSTKEPETVSEISAMVNYMEPASFYSFEYAAKKNVAYECCSISENSATNLLKEAPHRGFCELSRIYPKGTRVDSGNYMPQLFWNSGCCQLVESDIGQSRTPTRRPGPAAKPGHVHTTSAAGGLPPEAEFMRRPDRRFDPFARDHRGDGIVASSVSVEILSRLFFVRIEKSAPTLRLEMYGLPADTIRPSTSGILKRTAEHSRKTAGWSCQLATLRIARVGRVWPPHLGQRFLPVDSLRPPATVTVRGSSGQSNTIPERNGEAQPAADVLTEDFEVTNKPHQPQPQPASGQRVPTRKSDCFQTRKQLEAVRQTPATASKAAAHGNARRS